MTAFTRAFATADGSSFDGLLKMDRESVVGQEFKWAVDAYLAALARFDCPRGLYATAAEVAEASGESVGVWITTDDIEAGEG